MTAVLPIRADVGVPRPKRARVLESAGALFARRGFNGVGLRDIARRARVSLRMPNHHFGSKDRLYAECVRYALAERLQFPILFNDPPVFVSRGEARTALDRKVRACFFAIHPPSGGSVWYGEILGRAITENRPAVLAAMRKGLTPAREWFLKALRQAYPSWKSTACLLWYVSLWAEISFYSTARSSILYRAGKRRYDESLLRAAADHVVRVLRGPPEE